MAPVSAFDPTYFSLIITEQVLLLPRGTTLGPNILQNLALRGAHSRSLKPRFLLSFVS